MASARSYLSSLNPRLPLVRPDPPGGGLANAFGNGIVYPFLFIYLHNVRGFGLGTVGLVLATNGAVSLVVGPASGPLVDRVGGRRTLLISLAFSTIGYGGYAFVASVPAAFATSFVAGIGNGAFWPAQSALIASLTPRDARTAAFAMQRVVMNLGFGLGRADRRPDRLRRVRLELPGALPGGRPHLRRLLAGRARPRSRADRGPRARGAAGQLRERLSATGCSWR